MVSYPPELLQVCNVTFQNPKKFFQKSGTNEGNISMSLLALQPGFIAEPIESA
jgi:hypothetical protein